MKIINIGYVIQNDQKIQITPENVVNFKAKDKFITVKLNNGAVRELSYKELAKDLCEELELVNQTFDNNTSIVGFLAESKLLIYDNQGKIILPEVAAKGYVQYTYKCIVNNKILIKSSKYGSIAIKMGSNPVLNLENEIILLPEVSQPRIKIEAEDLKRFLTYIIYKSVQTK